ncbi:MAG: hypothetical protein LBJ74_05545 [Heliobacteriaceae bacterium]|nr:hypothetical protein [Heliobacteriaceae bacterium]
MRIEARQRLSLLNPFKKRPKMFKWLSGATERSSSAAQTQCDEMASLFKIKSLTTQEIGTIPGSQTQHHYANNFADVFKMFGA